MAVSDLNGRKVYLYNLLKLLQGPCGGLFWSEEDEAPFIVAVFKGTTPTSETVAFVEADVRLHRVYGRCDLPENRCTSISLWGRSRRVLQ